MLPAPLHYTPAFVRWSKFYDQLKAQCPTTTITRAVKAGPCAGRVQEVARQASPIPGSCYHTARALIKLAIQAANLYRNDQLLRLDYQHTDQVPEGILVSINHVALGKMLKKHPRTMYTHVMALMGGETSLILEKYFRGWRRNIELVINSRFLFKMVYIKEGLAPFNAFAAQEAELPALADSTKRPPIIDPNGIVNSTLTDEVEKWTTQATENSARPGGADAAGEEARPEPAKKGAGGAREAAFYQKSKTTCPVVGPSPAASTAAILARYSEELFKKANKLLYKRRFTAEQYQLSLEAIKAGVYRHLDTTHLSLRQWQQYHDGCLQRVEIARKWFAKHTERTISWPYALYSNGLGYFDAENLNGFIRTEQWFVENEVKRHQRRINDALRSAETEFSQFKQLQRGEKITVCKRVKESTAWELYRWHENRIKQFGGHHALDKFYALTAATAKC